MAIEYERVIALKVEGRETAYGDREAMLYALGVGFGADPMDRAELPFVYEKRLRVLPTMATVIPVETARRALGLNELLVLHGEQRLTVHKPLPPAAQLYADWRVAEVIDKGPGRGALVVTETILRLRQGGEKLVTLASTTFARGDGGFGGPSGGGPIPHPTPTHRAPDKEVSLTTRADQALLYRLNGDRNPLHSDPDVAKAAGFARPILHGLCTYGIACRAVLQGFCNYDPSLLRQFDVRFSAPVYPGETILTRMWKDGDVVSFDAVVVERGETVLKNGKAVLGV